MSIFSLPAGLIMLDSFAPAYASEDLSFFIRMIFWNENSDRFTHNLSECVAIQLLRGRIPTRHNTVEIFAENGIVGRVHESAEKRFRGFCFLPALALCDVACNLRRANDPAEPI